MCCLPQQMLWNRKKKKKKPTKVGATCRLHAVRTAVLWDPELMLMTEIISYHPIQNGSKYLHESNSREGTRPSPSGREKASDVYRNYSTRADLSLSAQSDREEATDENWNYLDTSHLHESNSREGTLPSPSGREEATDEYRNYSTAGRTLHDCVLESRANASRADLSLSAQSDRKEATDENWNYLDTSQSDNDYTADDDCDPEWMPDGDASQLNDLSVYEYFEKFKNNVLSDHESGASSAGEDEVDEEPLDNKSKMRKRNRILKEKGSSYKRMDGTVVQARRVQPPCGCKMRCYDKFSESVRQNLLLKLLTLTQSGQNQFLSNHIVVINTVRPKVLISRRTRSRIYRLPGVGGPVKVCKLMFMATFDLKDRKVRTLANKLVLGQGVASDDMRKGNCSRKQISPEHADYIIKHIKSFPAEESHYGREKSSRLYLSSDLNVQRMYELYQDQCGVDNFIPVHYNTYRRAFNTQNLKFRKPKIDTCNTCDMLKVELQVEKDEEKRKEVIVRKEAHQLEAQRIYDEKRDDKKRADQDICAFTD
ncbi:uncharacterized protein LOC135711607 [Ochlerotatus camptorhynchus]|uniref:uncharacterized protein LOC135711607 n=1 Tax=Ochlerotatus camptorhynchus TaxID=644619 RepID=UPI0031D7FEE8